MTAKENQTSIIKVYNKAVENGIVTNKSQFAKLVGVDRTHMSLAMNGGERNATDKLVDKCQRAVDEAMKGERVLPEKKNDHTFIHHTADENIQYFVDKMVGEMAAQRESYERILLAALQFDKKND